MVPDWVGIFLTPIAMYLQKTGLSIASNCRALTTIADASDRSHRHPAGAWHISDGVSPGRSIGGHRTAYTSEIFSCKSIMNVFAALWEGSSCKSTVSKKNSYRPEMWPTRHVPALSHKFIRAPQLHFTKRLWIRLRSAYAGAVLEPS